MWIFEYRKVSCLYILIELSSPRKVSTNDLDYSHASYMKLSWLGHASYVECIVFVNQCKVALNGYALKDFMNLLVMHRMDACGKFEQML